MVVAKALFPVLRWPWCLLQPGLCPVCSDHKKTLLQGFDIFRAVLHRASKNWFCHTNEMSIASNACNDDEAIAKAK